MRALGERTYSASILQTFKLAPDTRCLFWRVTPSIVVENPSNRFLPVADLIETRDPRVRPPFSPLACRLSPAVVWQTVR